MSMFTACSRCGKTNLYECQQCHRSYCEFHATEHRIGRKHKVELHKWISGIFACTCPEPENRIRKQVFVMWRTGQAFHIDDGRQCLMEQ